MPLTYNTSNNKLLLGTMAEARYSGRLLRKTRDDDIDEESCLIRFYKVQYYDDPTPYSFKVSKFERFPFRNSRKHRANLQEQSIRVYGECCWKVYK